MADFLTKHRAVRFFIEANDERLPLAKCWGAQVARWTEQQFAQRLCAGILFLHVNVNNSLPFRRVDFIYLRGQFERLFFLPCVLLGVDLFLGFMPRVCKKLLRFSARLSSGAVITPVNFRHLKTS